MALTFDVYRPAVPNGAAVIFVNSGGFVSGQIRQCEAVGWGEYRFVPPAELHLEGQTERIPLLAQFSFAPLLEAGFTLFDVRHAWGPGFPLPEIVADIRDAVRFIHANAVELRVDPDRIGLWGASAGGYLALHAAFANEEPAAGVEGLTAGTGRARSVAVYYPAGYDLAGDTERFPELIAELPALQVDAAVLDSLSLRHTLSPSESVCVGLTRLGVECRRIAIPGTGHEFRGPDGYRPEAGEQASQAVVAWFRETLLTGR